MSSSSADRWNLIAPLAALAVLGLAYLLPGGWLTGLACAGALIAAVLAAVHHAEDIAHRTGEPFGTLVLALAVTVIEVALIVAMMAGGGAAQTALARDTIFSTLMIVGNGVVGLCAVIASLRYGEPAFRATGAQAAFSTLIAMTTLTLVLPSFTISSSGPTYTGAQLAFAAAMSLLLWVAYVAVQTLRHREHFLPAGDPAPTQPAAGSPGRSAGASAALLVAALVAVVGLAKVLSPGIEAALAAAGAPRRRLAWRLPYLSCCPRRSRPSGPRGATNSRPASTSPTVPRWPASASPSRRWPSRRSGYGYPSSLASRPRTSSCCSSRWPSRS
jgi:Ca2+:H+ antiporter